MRQIQYTIITEETFLAVILTSCIFEVISPIVNRSPQTVIVCRRKPFEQSRRLPMKAHSD